MNKQKTGNQKEIRSVLAERLKKFVPKPFQTWQELAAAVGLHPTTIQKYREGKSPPSRQSLLEFAAMEAVEAESAEDASDAAAHDQKLKQAATEWLKLAGREEHVKKVDEDDLKILRSRASQHQYRKTIASEKRELMEICKKTQDLAKTRIKTFIAAQLAAKATTVLGFLWAWKEQETHDYLRIAETHQYIADRLRENPKLHVWAFFALVGADTPQKRANTIKELRETVGAWDQAGIKGEDSRRTASATSSSPNSTMRTDRLVHRYADRFKIWVGGRESYRHLGDYWLLLPAKRREAQAYFVSVDPDLLSAAWSSGIPDLVQNTWNYCAHIVQLHDEGQVDLVIDYFGIQPRLMSDPPWIVTSGNFSWEPVKFAD